MTLQILMYHYVRNNEEYFYDTYCRRINEFEAQVDIIQKNSPIINPFDSEQINYYLTHNDESAFMLTFDDAYKDHLYCARFLHSKSINGLFFPVIDTIEGKLLNVNKIHILLGNRSQSNQEIFNMLVKIIRERKTSIILDKQIVELDTYLNSFKETIRFGNEIQLFVKRLLQRDILNLEDRDEICNILLDKFVSSSLSKLASELYLNKNDMTLMKQLGMCFGSHTVSHSWLGGLSDLEQKNEINTSFYKLKTLKLIEDDQTHFMCYPYGDFNQSTLKILSDSNINYGLTVNPGSSKISKKLYSNLQLNRWDTNDFWDDIYRKPILLCK